MKGAQRMKQTGIREEVLEEICALARKHDIEKVILFGSRARGNYQRGSDIDLAVLGGDVMRFALDVDEEASTLLEFDVIDLSLPLQEEFLNSIKEEGIVLYEKV